MTTNESGEKAEEVLKSVYDEEFNVRQMLDDKANGMMGTAATVATLYGGFGLAVSSKLFNAPLQANFQVITLFIGVSLLIACLFYAAKANLLKPYVYAMNYHEYIQEIKPDDYVVFNNVKIDELFARDSTNLNKLMVKIYIKCIAINHRINGNRHGDLKTSQIVFFMGLFSIPLFIISSINFGI